MIVKQINKHQAHSFIKEHELSYFMNKEYKGSKYEFSYRGKGYDWYGVFENDNMIAVQVTDRPVERDIHLVCLQKIPGTHKGVFKAIMDYFSDYNIHFESYNEKLQKMYKRLGFKQINDFEFVRC